MWRRPGVPIVGGMTPQTQSRTATETVGSVYKAFGAGDVPGILALLADDVVFDADRVESSAATAGHPLLVGRRGRDEVTQFFLELGRVSVERFEVRGLLADAAGSVAALISIELV